MPYDWPHAFAGAPKPWAWRTALAWCGYLVGLISAGCRDAPARDAAPRPTVQLEAQAAGCAEVTVGPSCGLPADRTIRLLLKGGDALRCEASGQLLEPSSSSVHADGRLGSYVIPAGGTELRCTANTPQGMGAWSLRLHEPEVPGWLAQARALRKAGELDAAMKKLAPMLEGQGSDRARALGLAARIHLQRAELDEAVAVFEQAVEADRAAGRLSDQVDDALALSYTHAQRTLAYGKARAALDGLTEGVSHYPEGGARVAYYRALIAVETGNARLARTLLRECAERASLLGMDKLRGDAEKVVAAGLRAVGQARESLAALRAIEARQGDSTSACDRGILAVMLGQSAVATVRDDAADPDAPALKEARHEFEKASGLFAKACPDSFGRANAMAEWASVELKRARYAEAEALLRASRAVTEEPGGVLPPFWLGLEGRLALARGKPAEALQAFGRELSLAVVAGNTRARWDATLGRAMALEALHRHKPAAEAYAECEQLLDSATWMVPLGEGRGAFVRDRDVAARRRIDLLLRMGDARSALDTARRSRSRVLASLRVGDRLQALEGDALRRWEEAMAAYHGERAALERAAQDDWKRSALDLQRIRPARTARVERMRARLEQAIAELTGQQQIALPDLSSYATDAFVLAAHPAGNGWVVFGATAEGVEAVRVTLPPDPQPEVLSELLLSPFRDPIARVSRIRILPYGPLRQVDFHTLPWQGAPLGHHATVEYPLDVRPAAPTASSRSKLRAFVLGDPVADLPEGRLEASAIEGMLARSSRFEVSSIIGASGDRDEVLRRISRADLFHFAGHGVQQGTDGWLASLSLAEGREVGVSDILLMPRAPKWVVLSACEAAKQAEGGAAEGLGIAQAFVLAGSRAVVAATRRVPDKLAAELSLELTRILLEQSEVDLPMALRKAQINLILREEEFDWGAFRNLTP